MPEAVTGQARRGTCALRQLHAPVGQPGPAGHVAALAGTHVVGLDDATEDSLALGHVLKMDHAPQVELPQVSAKLMVTDVEPDVCGVPRNRLVPDIHDDFAAQDSV